MADTDRESQAGLSSRLPALWENPKAFDFFFALRLVESRFPEFPRLGTGVKPADDPVRLGQAPSLGFAPSTIAGVEHSHGSVPDRIDVLFQGLFGPNGPLPLHLTEYVYDRLLNAKDPTLARFADLFHHRMLSLFYRAWSASEPAPAYDRPDADEFGFKLGSLSGYGIAQLRRRDALPDLAKLYYSGLFANQSKNAEGLVAMVEDFFEVPCRIESFVGHWIRMSPEECTRLDGNPRTAALGATALLGSKVWDCQHKIRIVLGPLSLTQYEQFLPGSRALGRLVAMVRNYLDGTLSWDLQLVLRREEVPAAALAGSTRLGWSSWSNPEALQTDADDLKLEAERFIPLPLDS